MESEKQVFDYYYGNESNQFSFYRIPRQLITGGQFKRLSIDAKLLYGLLLDRMGLSAKNGWYDDQGRVYIYFTVDEVRENLCGGNDKALKILAELGTKKGVGLIERVKQGQGKPTKIYVKRLPPRPFRLSPPSLFPLRRNRFPRPEVQKSEIQASRHRFFRGQDMGKTEVQPSGNQKVVILIKSKLTLAILTHLSIRRPRRA